MRGLSPDFVDSLQNGVLNPVLERTKRDSTLDFQIRGNYVNVYYRGGNLLKIEKINLSDKFRFLFDKEYVSKSKNELDLPEKTDIQGWVEYIPKLKHVMDVYFTTQRKKTKENFNNSS